MTLDNDRDEVIGMITLTGGEDETVMVVSENGYGKRSAIADYPVTNRGGKGVKTLQITDKTGSLVAIKNVNDLNDLMIINQSGVALRLPVRDIRVMGRATQGVKLIDLGKRGDVIASVCKVDSNPEEEVEMELEEQHEHNMAERAAKDVERQFEQLENDSVNTVDETEQTEINN